jgi:hypothetical protein
LSKRISANPLSRLSSRCGLEPIVTMRNQPRGDKNMKIIEKTWMTAPTEEASKLQRPLPDGSVMIVVRSKKEDSGQKI